MLLVKGITQDLFNRVKDRITIYGTGAININTADKIVLKSLGMSDALADKIIHFRDGSDGEEATDDDNIFETIDAITETLISAENLSENEVSQLNNILEVVQFCVYSDNFTGNSFGSLKSESASIKIVFIFNRNKVVKYWREN